MQNKVPHTQKNQRLYLDIADNNHYITAKTKEGKQKGTKGSGKFLDIPGSRK